MWTDERNDVQEFGFRTVFSFMKIRSVCEKQKRYFWIFCLKDKTMFLREENYKTNMFWLLFLRQYSHISLIVAGVCSLSECLCFFLNLPKVKITEFCCFSPPVRTNSWVCVCRCPGNASTNHSAAPLPLIADVMAQSADPADCLRKCAGLRERDKTGGFWGEVSR